MLQPSHIESIYIQWNVPKIRLICSISMVSCITVGHNQVNHYQTEIRDKAVINRTPPDTSKSVKKFRVLFRY